jgi:transcriptional regulator with XRE-family HTH domain
MANDSPVKRKSASEKSLSPVGARIDEALAGRAPAWLAHQTGISSGSISEIRYGQMPGADRAIRIAQALEVPVEWLITGELPAARQLEADDSRWIMAPHYTLAQLAAADRGDPVDTLPIHVDWLTPEARRADKVWLTDLPAALADAGAEAGDMILCSDADRHDREGSYLYMMRDIAMVRRFEGPALSMLRDSGAKFDWRAVEPPDLRLVGRILGVMKLRPI